MNVEWYLQHHVCLSPHLKAKTHPLRRKDNIYNRVVKLLFSLIISDKSKCQNRKNRSSRRVLHTWLNLTNRIWIVFCKIIWKNLRLTIRALIQKNLKTSFKLLKLLLLWRASAQSKIPKNLRVLKAKGSSKLLLSVMISYRISKSKTIRKKPQVWCFKADLQIKKWSLIDRK
jgi:hypothetical protein